VLLRRGLRFRHLRGGDGLHSLELLARRGLLSEGLLGAGGLLSDPRVGLGGDPGNGLRGLRPDGLQLAQRGLGSVVGLGALLGLLLGRPAPEGWSAARPMVGVSWRDARASMPRVPAPSPRWACRNGVGW
jgi:hypothetical protein